MPVVKNGENGHLRQRGKVAELALGYGGSVGALKAMDAVRMGIPEGDLKPLVDAWREANPRITEYWWKVDEAVKTAIRCRIPQKVGNIRFEMRSSMLFISLPSGRKLAYVKPRIEETSSAAKASPTAEQTHRSTGPGWNPTARRSWRISSRPFAGTCWQTP